MNSSVFQVISNKKQEKEQNPPFSKKKSKSPSCIGYILLAKFLRILNGKVTQLEKPPGWRSPTSPFISGHVSFHHHPKGHHDPLALGLASHSRTAEEDPPLLVDVMRDVSAPP